MVAAARRMTMTVSEFLAWEDRQDERHEFVDGEIVAMVGETVGHSRIAGNLFISLTSRLRGTPCRAFQEGARVVTDSAVFYPDVAVTCTRLGDRERAIADPLVIVEVLSPSTERHDLLVKNRAYRLIDSLMQYVTVAQDRMAVESFRRTSEGWVHEPVDGLDGILRLPALSLDLPLADVYADSDVLAAALAAGSEGVTPEA